MPLFFDRVVVEFGRSKLSAKVAYGMLNAVDDLEQYRSQAVISSIYRHAKRDNVIRWP